MGEGTDRTDSRTAINPAGARLRRGDVRTFTTRAITEDSDSVVSSLTEPRLRPVSGLTTRTQSESARTSTGTASLPSKA